MFTHLIALLVVFYLTIWPAQAQMPPTDATLINCPVAVTSPTYQAGWFHNDPGGTLRQDGVRPNAPVGATIYGSANGPDVGNAVADAPDLMVGNGITYVAAAGGSSYSVGGVGNVDADASYSAGDYLTYQFTTVPTISARAIDRLGFGLGTGTANGTYPYRFTAIISKDNFVTATPLVSDYSVPVATSVYTFFPVPMTNQVIILPSTTYKIRIIFHNKTTAGDLRWDDFQFSTGTCPRGDLQITKTNTPGVNGEVDQDTDTLVAGATTAYTIVVRNNGPTSLDGAVVHDTISAGLACTDPVSCTGSPASVCGATSYPAAALTGEGVTLNTMSVGATATFVMQCTVQ